MLAFAVGGEHDNAGRARLVAKELARGNENERNNGKYEKIVLPTPAFEVPEDDSAEKTHSLRF